MEKLNKSIPILRDVSWRHKAARLKQPVDDPVVKRFISAINTGFEFDRDMYIVTQIKEHGRDQIEILALGGAPVEVIAEVTETPPKLVKLYLDTYFDVTDITSPLVLCQIAHKEMNPGLMSLKVYAAKRGWKAYLRMHRPEINIEQLNVKDELKKLFLDTKNKLEELAIAETGTAVSRELTQWGKLAKDVLAELAKLEEASAANADEDIQQLVANVGCDSEEKISSNIDDLDYFEIDEDE